MPEEKQKNPVDQLEEFKKRGYNWVCPNCNKVYREKRTEQYDDGHGGRQLDMCSCRCDFYLTIDETLDLVRKTLKEKGNGKKKGGLVEKTG